MKTTPEQRAEWARLAEAATPGPWKNAKTTDGKPVCFHVTPQVSEHYTEPANPEHVANMMLLDESREAVPALLTDLEMVELCAKETMKQYRRVADERDALQRQLAEAQARLKEVHEDLILRATLARDTSLNVSQSILDRMLITLSDAPALTAAIAAAVKPHKKIEDAARNLVEQKGRHNTEIAYGRLADALKAKESSNER